MMYLENIFVGMTVLFPIMWILILNGSYGSKIADDVRNMIVQLVLCLSLIAGLFLLVWDLPRVSSWIEIYVVAFGVLPFLLRRKIGIRYLPMLFAVSALIVFVASEFWEYPVFVYGTLGIANPEFTKWAGSWFDHIHRIYGFVIFGFLLRATHWKQNFLSSSLLVLAVVVPFLLLSPLLFNSYLSPFVVRTWSLVCLSLGIYFGLDIEEFSISINKDPKQLEEWS